MKFQPVMVPERLMGEVYALLAERMTRVDDSEAATPEMPVGTPAPVGAVAVAAPTAEGLARMKTLTNESVVALMDLCSDAQPEPVATSKFVAEAGMDMPTLRSGLGGLRRTLKAFLPDMAFPFESAWGPNIGKQTAEMYYWHTPEVAALWREVRAAA